MQKRSSIIQAISGRPILCKERWCIEMIRNISRYVLCLAVLVGCLAEKSPPQSPTQPTKPPRAGQLTLATTTSTQDSGLLDELLPAFESESGVNVKVITVGSGQALELARRGDADVLLTHAPAAEQKFMDEGWGEERRPLMHNDFVLAGPKADPAHCKGQASITDAFLRIAEHEASFVSRGDESGTHLKEKEIWTKAGIEPQGQWYLQAGAGMAQTLRIANEKEAYTLSDRATYLTLRKGLGFEILTERDPLMQNHYAVLITNKAKHPHVNAEAARQLADFLLRPATKKRIAEFGVPKFGEPLFFPEE
jgi:tungstate transport system substrate-binding protein